VLGADEFIARFPQIDFVDVGAAVHMVAGDRNDLFAGAVVEFSPAMPRTGNIGTNAAAGARSAPVSIDHM